MGKLSGKVERVGEFNDFRESSRADLDEARSACLQTLHSIQQRFRRDRLKLGRVVHKDRVAGGSK